MINVFTLNSRRYSIESFKLKINKYWSSITSFPFIHELMYFTTKTAALSMEQKLSLFNFIRGPFHSISHRKVWQENVCFILEIYFENMYKL